MAGNDTRDHSIISQISDDIAHRRVSIDNPTHNSLPGTFARLRDLKTKNLGFERSSASIIRRSAKLDPNYGNIVVCTPLKDKLDGLDTHNKSKVRKKIVFGS